MEIHDIRRMEIAGFPAAMIGGLHMDGSRTALAFARRLTDGY